MIDGDFWIRIHDGFILGFSNWIFQLGIGLPHPDRPVCLSNVKVPGIQAQDLPES